jgi:hypothetical protein
MRARHDVVARWTRKIQEGAVGKARVGAIAFLLALALHRERVDHPCVLLHQLVDHRPLVCRHQKGTNMKPKDPHAAMIYHPLRLAHLIAG